MSTEYYADIGIIGGTGIYDSEFFSKTEDVKVHTPYGSPSDLITIGEYAGKKIAFIPRHGRNHRIPPHRINNRANIWALKQMGVKRIVAPTAVGSMNLEFKPGDIIIPDQFVDFTKGRQYTFYDGDQVCHISLADPFCRELRNIVNNVKDLNYNLHPNATYICVEGPRFSTRAESQFYRDVVKADIIGMTLVPECQLSREAKICYLSIATVTDYDVWADLAVTSKEIIRTLHNNVEKAKKLIGLVIDKIPPERTNCTCAHALEESLV